MSVCLSSNDKITTSVDLYNACKKSGYEIKKDKSIKSTCEKELHRITSLFRQDVGFNVTETIKSFSPNKFAKIYDIHAVPNILLNFAILDILNEKNNDGEYIYKKIPKIIDLLFLNIEEKDIDDIKDNFRKHALRDRLIELSEYGFVKKDGDKYALNSMYLNEDQINALKWVVPFFCGCYPFTSIGHFLANRLEISDMFVFESFNIKNILDDCVTYDLLEAINNKQEVSLKLYNNEKPVKFKPNEIYTDKNNKSLLTVKDKNDNKYLLSQIDTVEQDVKTKNLIFSEIYSFYYRIIEESLKKRTPENDVNESSIKEIIEKFGTKDTNNYPDKDTNKIFIQAINNIIRKLQNLDNCLIPLTTLELRWLKTIMLDKRFDLFVDNKETLFDDLVKDIEPFDLSCFKDSDTMTRTLWSMIPETLAFAPLGIGWVPYEVPGSLELANATLEKIRNYDVTMWEKHGVFAVGQDIMDAFDQVDVLNKAANIYMCARNMGGEPEGLSAHAMKDVQDIFNLPKQRPC